MSQRSFGFGNRQALMNNYSLERAAPRESGQGEKRYHHPVIPISSGSVPHYAQASQLYPMRTSTERDSMYKYKPGNLGAASGSSASPTCSGQPISIPVLHLSQARSPVPSTGYSGSHGNLSSVDSPSTKPVPDSTDGGFRSPSYRTSSVFTTTGRTGGRTPAASEQEAEVDALTNVLLQSMETRSSMGSSANTNALTTSMDGSTSSPAGSLRRGSGPSASISLNSQIGRLQQHLGMSPSPTNMSTVNGRGSPLTTGVPVSTASVTGSSSTNSPTGSTSSIHNASEVIGGGTTITGTNYTNNTCFRCRRALIAPEGTTLNPSLSSSSNNVVTLTGALAVRLHVACFTCYRCAAPLKPDAYYHSFRRLLCPACVRDGAVETCSNCRKPIGDQIVHALGLPYHPNCFVCVVCTSRLDSRPFTIDVHGRLHCLDDFHRRYAPRCTSCGRAIAPEPGSQEARRIVSGDSNFHLECFGVQTVPQSNVLSSKLGKGIVS